MILLKASNLVKRYGGRTVVNQGSFEVGNREVVGLLGRNGMHRYNNQDHSMLTAMVAVDNIVAGRTDKSNLWAVNTEQDYHEAKESQ